MQEITKMTDRDVLKEYLGQYYRAKMKKKQLEIRLRDFRENTENNGIHTIEIEKKIEFQKKEIQETILNVMKIMDFLPVDSMERIIMEYRHIDCIGWKQICREVNYSRAACNNYYKAGIKKLLTFKEVQKIITDFSKSKGINE